MKGDEIMVIDANTEMLLFRFNNYKRTTFIDEHLKVLNQNGFVWMLKVGKRSSLQKLNEIVQAGGWLVLRAPKADGSKSFLAKFVEVREETPEDMTFPEYYDEIISGNEVFSDGYADVTHQWFKLTLLDDLSESDARKLILSKTKRPIDEIIPTTRTAVMFIQNGEDILVKGV